MSVVQGIIAMVGFHLQLLVLAGAVHLAQGDEWKGFEASFEVQTPVQDARSPNLQHEHIVLHGAELPIMGQAFSVTIDAEAIQLSAAPEVVYSVSLKRLPSAVSVEVAGKPYAVWIRLDAWGQVQLSSLMGVRLQDAAIAVDSDMDGAIRPGPSSGDGLVLAGSRTVGPLPSAIACWGTHRPRRYRLHGDRGWEWQAIAMPRSHDRDHSRAWARLNQLRQQCGLLPLRYDESLEGGMRAHADYMKANRTLTHYQDPARPQASPAGAAAGEASNVTSWGRTHGEAVDEFLATLFHRDALLAPELSASALVIRHGFGLMDVRSHLDSPMKGGLLIFPAHGMTDAPRRFARGERPHPIAPARNGRPLGPPVGLYQRSLWFAKGFAEPPELSLALQHRRGLRQVSGPLFHGDNAPAHIRAAGLTGYAGAISRIPEQPLPKGAHLQASLSVGFDHKTLLLIARDRAVAARSHGVAIPYRTLETAFRYDWTFVTGRR